MKITKISTKMTIILYIIIDIICVGMGMGVPFFPILLGFPLGWYIAKRESETIKQPQLLYRKILKSSIFAAIFTFLLMLLIWGFAIPMIFNPNANFQNFGHPFILYEPKASFIAWLVLMIFISPFLQLLTTIFAAFITLAMPKIKR